MIYSIVMNKGGVGKTSLVTNVAAALSKRGKKVLIIDTDAQSNCALSFGYDPDSFKKTIYNVFVEDTKIENATIKITKNLFLVPSNDEMDRLEFMILKNIEKYPAFFDLLNSHVTRIASKYDYIFIDSPPHLGLVTGNILAINNNNIIIPFEPERYSVRGLTRVIDEIYEFKKAHNPNIEIAGVLGMRVDSRTVLHSDVMQQIRQYCARNNLRMYDTIIPRSIRFATSVAYNKQPAVWTDSSNVLVAAYYELIEEVFTDE